MSSFNYIASISSDIKFTFIHPFHMAKKKNPTEIRRRKIFRVLLISFLFILLNRENFILFTHYWIVIQTKHFLLLGLFFTFSLLLLLLKCQEMETNLKLPSCSWKISINWDFFFFPSLPLFSSPRGSCFLFLISMYDIVRMLDWKWVASITSRWIYLGTIRRYTLIKFTISFVGI